MLIDIGGQKAKRDMNGKWKICDIAKGSDHPCNLNTEPLPFKNNSIDAIFCSHLLEHLEPDSLPKALQEMKRVLKPDSPMRICVPDAGLAVKLYVENPQMLKKPGMPSKLKSVPDTKMGYLTCWFYTSGKGHRIGFDWELLQAYLKQAGFKKIAKKKFNKGSEVFKGKDYTRYRTNSIFCEVVK
jgi:predicted SAM-dependent methyltransferase